MKRHLVLFLLFLVLLGGACAGPNKIARFPVEPHASIYLINHGYHTGLVVRRADIPAGLWPESEDFPGADYLELGWGDRDYYPADDPGAFLMLKAALGSAGSVIQVIGIQGAVSARFGGFEIVRLDPGRRGFSGLMHFIHASFVRAGTAPAQPLSPGLVGNSFFYAAHGRFHLFSNCNGWIARALEAAGYPMGIFRPVTSDQLMAKVRPYAAPWEP